MEAAERERRRDTFLGAAEDYAAARPDYPPELLERVVRSAGLPAGADLLEIGCGTGEATQWFAQRGYRILALDRSEAMVTLARRRLEGLRGVAVEQRDLELDPPGGDRDGILAATSYHWLDPADRVERLAGLLRPGGALMLLWHTHPHPYTGYFERAQDVYRDLVPGWTPPSTPGMAEDGIRRIIEELARGGVFGHIERASHDWSRVYDRALYLRLLDTYSDHRLLDADLRTELRARLARLIDDEYGGVVERPYRTEAVIARRTSLP